MSRNTSLKLMLLTCAAICNRGPALADTPPASSGKPVAVQPGSYECWANGEARLLMNFTIKDGQSYTGSDDSSGTYLVDQKNSHIVFKGGSLDGVMPPNFYAVYHLAQGRPTVSFMGPSGSEASYCEHK